jgi:nucleoside-diphosphate-sugar epimerase
MTILVTGAAGLLGGHLIDVLVEQGLSTRALVQPGESTKRLSEAGVEIHVGDVRDRGCLEAVVSGVEYVLHCAARTGPWGPEDDYRSTNLRAVADLVGVAVSAGVRRVVHVSSVTVHGNDVRGEADESAPLRDEPNPYSRSKVAGERLLQQMIERDGVPVTIVRPGWIYGPRDPASFARFASMVRDGKMITIGSGWNHLPLIYARDAAAGVWQAARADDAVGRAYILVNDEVVTQREFLGAIASELGVPPPSRRIPYRVALAAGTVAELAARLAHRRQPPPLTRYGVQLLGGENRFSIDRARRELGFSPQVCLADGVRRSATWFRSAQDGVLSVRGR